MQPDQRIRDEIDRSVGEGPPGVPVDDLLTRGHRALARRRILAGAGATLAVVAIVGGGAVAVGGSGAQVAPAPRYAERPSASPVTPTSAPAPVLRTPSQREADRALRLPLAELDDRGRLVLAPQVEVVRRIDDPFGSSETGKSVALELNYHRVRYWFLLNQAPDRSHWETLMWPGDYDGSFASWVEEQRPTQQGSASSGGGQWPGIPDLELVRFVGSTERLEPVAGATILRQRAHVSVGDSFPGPDGQTAAAKVEAADGERYYVLARRPGGGTPQYIAVTEADGGPTLGSFLDLARSRYADNGGGLL